MNTALKTKESALLASLGNYDSLAVAFSGGVDSALLLDAAHEVLGSKVLALTACFACFPRREQAAAQRFCADRDIRHIEFEFDAFAVAGFSENPPNRCYLCKRALLAELMRVAEEHDVSVLAEGSNLDDESDYRPGLAAIDELGVASPLRLAGLTKADIRVLSKERGLPTWDKPACACLATRLPFGAQLSPELITRIDRAEECVLEAGALQVRVRVHDDLARIEVDRESIPLLLDAECRQTVDKQLKALGFTHVTLDLDGYTTGSMN